MRAFMPTFDFQAYRVNAIDLTEWADDTHLALLSATTVRPPHREIKLEFVVSSDNARRSTRFDALMRACGIRNEPEANDFVGRYFALKNGGSDPDDFDRLEYAAACLQSDREAHVRSLAYAAEYAAEERLGVAA